MTEVWNGRWLLGWALLGGVATLAACSPVFNWRDVGFPGRSLQAMLPCKPEKAERTVPLAGHRADLHMLSCDAGKLTFAIAALRKPNDVTASDVVQAWTQAGQLSLRAQADRTRVWMPVLQGVVAVKAWQAQGVRHDGSPVLAHVLFLAQGDDVFQVAVYGPVTPDVLETLVESLRLSPAS